MASLLEIYTSEGCSSCPPAERWFSGLKVNPRLWKDLVPVAFHVDYWDGLGWKDPFASPVYSGRQRSYAQSWRTESVYTPGFVLDGNEWRGWFQRKELPTSNGHESGVLTAISNGAGKWTIRYEPVIDAKGATYRVHGALLGFDLKTAVKAGENNGRLLQHDFVVLRFESAKGVRAVESFQAEVALNGGVPADTKRLAAAFWVTLDTGLRALQAVGGWLK